MIYVFRTWWFLWKAGRREQRANFDRHLPIVYKKSMGGEDANLGLRIIDTGRCGFDLQVFMGYDFQQGSNTLAFQGATNLIPGIRDACKGKNTPGNGTFS